MNQLIENQSEQQETLVHSVSILNVTRYVAQINRHSINILIDRMDETSQDVNNLYNLTNSLATSISYHQIILIHQISFSKPLRFTIIHHKGFYTHHGLHRCSYNWNTFSIHFTHNGSQEDVILHRRLPSTLHLPVSSKDTLHFYHYLCTHVLIANKQFLLLINVRIQNRSQQLSIYKVITLDIPHGNFTACYDVNTKYLGIIPDETMVVEISPQQFRICQEANRQFYTIPMQFQPLANPPSCITALYVKNTASISARCSLQIRKSSGVSMPSQLAPSVWILMTAPSAATATITLICLGETTQFIEVKRPIHILCLATACSATSPSFTYPHIMKDHLWK